MPALVKQQQAFASGLIEAYLIYCPMGLACIGHNKV
jgi:hypothetical protein